MRSTRMIYKNEFIAQEVVAHEATRVNVTKYFRCF